MVLSRLIIAICSRIAAAIIAIVWLVGDGVGLAKGCHCRDSSLVGGLDVFWNRLMRMGYCRQNIGFDNRLPLHILDLMMWLVGVWKDLG